MKLRALALVALISLGLAACQPLSQLVQPTERADKAEEEGGRLGPTETADAEATGMPEGHAGLDGADEVLSPTAAVTATVPITGTVAGTSAGLAVTGAPKAADPLTTLEQERAAALALGSPELETLTASALDRDAVTSTSTAELRALSGRPSYRVLYTQRAPDKTGTLRAADVAVYRYDTDQAAVSTVNLADGEVVAQELPPGYMAPLVPEEIAEAAQVAKQDPAVRDALTAAGLDPATVGANALLTRGLDEASPCATHRCVKVFFSSAERPVPTFEVVVDLSALSVVELLPFPEGNGSDQP